MTDVALEYFVEETGDTLTKCEELSEQLKVLEDRANDGGFSAAHFTTLCQVIQTKKMPAQIYRKLISCLVPYEPVPGATLCDLILFVLGHQLNLNYVVNPVLQVANLCLEYDLVTEKKLFVSLYEVFLSKMKDSVLCDTIAQILAKITTLADVDRRRACVIKKCYDHHGGTPSLNMLRYRIRQLRPDLEPTYSPPTGTAGKLNNTLLKKRFQKIYEESTTRLRPSASGGLCWESGQLGNALDYKDRQRRCLLPNAETINLKSGLKSQRHKKTPIHTIETMVEGLNKLEDLELPNNILSLLPTQLAKFILPRQDLRERFSLVLYHTLHKEFFCLPRASSKAESERRERRQRRFLDILAKFITGCFHGVPVVGRFLSEYLTEWDGEKYYYEILNLLRVIQLTNFRELYDTLLAPIEAYMHKFPLINKLFLVDAYFGLLRFWCTVELTRMINMSGCLFPDSTQVGSDGVLTQIILFTSHIQEVATLVLSSARDTFDGQRVWVTRLLVDMFTTTQEMFVKMGIPVLVQMPEPLVHADIYTFSSLGICKVSKYLLDQKKQVLPLLKEKSVSMSLLGKTNTASLIKQQTSSQGLANLESVARDVLMIMSPTLVFKHENSVFNKAGLNENDMIRDLFLSEHPSFLSVTFSYFRDRPESEVRSVWSGLTSDRVYATQNQVNPIFLSTTASSTIGAGTGNRRVSSVQFYKGRLSSNQAAVSNPEVDMYLKYVGADLAEVGAFFKEFWGSGLQPGNSVISMATESSGVFTMESMDRTSKENRPDKSDAYRGSEKMRSSTKKRKSQELQNSDKITRSKRTRFMI